jgi:tetratricopeptide (TPR) repeat protein
MQRTLPALLAATFLLSLPTLGSAQQASPPRQAPAVKPAPSRPLQFALVPLSGRYLAARVAEQDHDYEGAADEIDRALVLSPDDPDLVYSAFRMRMYAGRIDQAAELAPQVLARKPGDAMANLILAVQSIKKGDYRTAELQLGRIGTDNSMGAVRELMLVWLKAGEKDFAGARALLAKLQAAGAHRGEGASLIDEAQLDEMAGDKAAAEAKYRRAMAQEKNNLRATIAIAGGLRRLGKADDADELLKSAGEKFADSVVMDGLIGPNAPMPKPPSAAAGISDILFELGGSLVADPRNPRADLALIFYELSLSLRPDNDFAWLLLSSLYEQFDMTAKATAALAHIGPSSPLHWQARLQIASLDAKQDHYDEAVSRLQAMVAEKPERIDAALRLADLLRSKERYGEAAQAYDIAIQRIHQTEERYWPVYFGRGIVLERLKQWPKAEADMKKALELSPDQPHVLNYLGYSWIDQGLHLQDGMKMLERATELRPDDGAITDSVGWAFYRLGQYDKAVEWLEKAIEQKSDDATITEHLGDAYWHVGRFREARFQWERALNQKPDKDRLPVIKDKLANGLSAANDKPTVYERAADGKQGG